MGFSCPRAPARAAARARFCAHSYRTTTSTRRQPYAAPQLPQALLRGRRGCRTRRAVGRARADSQIRPRVLARSVALEGAAPLRDRLLAASERVEREAGLDRGVEEVGMGAAHARKLRERPIGQARLAQRDPEPV